MSIQDRIAWSQRRIDLAIWLAIAFFIASLPTPAAAQTAGDRQFGPGENADSLPTFTDGENDESVDAGQSEITVYEAPLDACYASTGEPTIVPCTQKRNFSWLPSPYHPLGYARKYPDPMSGPFPFYGFWGRGLWGYGGFRGYYPRSNYFWPYRYGSYYGLYPPWYPYASYFPYANYYRFPRYYSAPWYAYYGPGNYAYYGAQAYDGNEYAGCWYW